MGTKPNHPFLAFYRPPFDDELLHGWLSSLAASNYILDIHGIQKIVKLFFPYSSRPEHRASVSKDPVRMDFVKGLSESIRLIHISGYSFPSPSHTLAYHTPLVAIGIAKTSGEQARYIHTACASVNGDWYDMPSLPQTIGHIVACPKCLEESRHIRTWHHLPGVTVCARHSIPLRRVDEKAFRERNLFLLDSEETTGFVTNEALDYARYAKTVYDTPTDISLEHIYRYLMDRPDRLSAENAKRFGKKSVPFVYLVHILMHKVPDYASWAKRFAAVMDADRPAELFKMGIGGVGDFRCLHCGHIWTDSIEAVRLGMSCPSCMSSRLPDDFMNNILHSIGDGRYTLTEPFRGMGATQEVLHKTCGKVLRGRMSTRIWQHTACQCEYRESAESLQARINEKVRGFTVLSYTHTRGVLCVRHDVCGSIRKLSYTSFLSVPYCPACRAEELRTRKDRKIISVLGSDYEIEPSSPTAGTVSVRHIPCGTIMTETYDSFIRSKRHCPICVPYLTSKRDGTVATEGRLYMEMKNWLKRHRVWISNQHKADWNGRTYRRALAVLVKKGFLYHVARGTYSDRTDVTVYDILEEKYLIDNDGHSAGRFTGETARYLAGDINIEPAVVTLESRLPARKYDNTVWIQDRKVIIRGVKEPQ